MVPYSLIDKRQVLASPRNGGVNIKWPFELIWVCRGLPPSGGIADLLTCQCQCNIHAMFIFFSWKFSSICCQTLAVCCGYYARRAMLKSNQHREPIACFEVIYLEVIYLVIMLRILLHKIIELVKKLHKIQLQLTVNILQNCNLLLCNGITWAEFVVITPLFFCWSHNDSGFFFRITIKVTLSAQGSHCVGNNFVFYFKDLTPESLGSDTQASLINTSSLLFH